MAQIKAKVAAMGVLQELRQDWGCRRAWVRDYLSSATDNPTASGLFAERLKALREKDNFGAVLFSSHVRKVNRFSKSRDRALLLTDRHLYKLDPGRQYRVMRAVPLEASCRRTLRDPGICWNVPECTKHVSGPDPSRWTGAESRVFTGSAPDGKRGHRPAPCPGPALDAVLDVPTQRLPRRPGERREAHIGRALGRVAPSMLLCSLSEAICFFLGALTPMPAVRTFALTSGFAVVLDFLLQVSAFVALLSLDSRRQEASRLDVCCCVGAPKLPPPDQSEGFLLQFFRKFYVPFLLHRLTRAVVLLLFMGLFGVGLYFMCHVSVGLDQELALPKDSYLLDYFSDLNRYFEVGAPVYFVTTGGYNFSSEAGMNAICSSAGCDSYSLTQKIQYATEFPDESYLAIPASSWVDDFIDWLTPSSCCRLYAFGAQKDEFCPSTVNSLACLKNCVSFTLGPIRPTDEQFHKYLPWFLSDPPNIKCPKGGLAAYNTSVHLGSNGEVLASRFMAYHKPLRNSQDYTEALRASRELAANITAHLRQVPGTDPAFEVFPYTITNVFYEQYLNVVPEGLFMLAICLLPTFIVCCLLLGMDLRSGLLNLFSIVMILVDTVGFMALWGISYNAVSLINLVTAVGISVEFVSHITRAFAVSTRPTRLERAKEATVFMGSAVFAGVAMTNLPGILVLGLAKAQLIQIFFFRLNLLITVLGLLHGLVFLPVVLSYVGPDVNAALVLEQKQMEEAAKPSMASCPSHPGPTSKASSTYVNHGFEQPAESGLDSSLPRSGHKF
ncbi:NPC1-like intracellular cholesterol transporter 1 [Ursus arctos]|uniref:NPC1-like intracellular cholesterol transporter 1 n=1 Tax=Ursus arctos TaxID=9644 RepID=UPI0025492578|nr:NPC1-like intracellular cholesterol transporter 1 [Ursus arctos]